LKKNNVDGHIKNLLGNKDNLPENAMDDFRKGYQGIRPDTETNQYYKPTKWCKPKGT